MHLQTHGLPRTLAKAGWLLSIGLALFCSAPSGAQTADGETPSAETVCDGEPNQLKGLCNAYCEAMDCDSGASNASDKACARVLDNYRKKSGGADPPCFESEVCDGVDNDEDGDVDEGFDLDGDGVARCCTSGPLFVTLDQTLRGIIGYMSDGDGTFTRALTPIAEVASGALGLTGVGDFNADGQFDVLWRTSSDRFLSVCDREWQTVPAGSWTYAYFGGADLDGNGDTDLVGWDMSCCFMSGPVLGPGVPALGLSALGTGAGGFSEVYGSFDPSSVLGAWQAQRTYNLEDATGDGFPDLIFLEYASGGASTSILYLAEGNSGTFKFPRLIGTTPGQPQNFGDMGDIDGDGCSDWVGGPDDDGNKGLVLAMFGDCAGGYSPPVTLVDTCVGCPGSGAAHGRGWSQLYDWDGDDDLDLLTGRWVDTGSSGTIGYWENDGSGHFSGPTTVVAPADLRNFAFASPLRN